MKPTINTPIISKGLLATFFISLTFFLAPPFMEATIISASCKINNYRQQVNLLSQFHDDIRESLIPIHEFYYLTAEQVAKDLAESFVALDTTNSSDKEVFRKYLQKIFAPSKVFNQNIIKTIASLERELNQKEREVLARYLYGYTLSDFNKIRNRTDSSTHPYLAFSLKVYTLLIANPFDKNAFLQKHEELLNIVSEKHEELLNAITDHITGVSKSMMLPKPRMLKSIGQRFANIICESVNTIL